MEKKITVYGFGNRGRDIIDQLIAQNINILMIFVNSPALTSYRGIEVRKLNDPKAKEIAYESTCIIALHNSYVDIRKIYFDVKAVGAKPISLICCEREGISIEVKQGFWLDQSASGYDISQDDCIWMKNNLQDSVSREIFFSLKKYRDTGDIGHCPEPSLNDEYIPQDLPRYQEPIHLLDCGAHTGLAYKKITQNYFVEKYLAFEPDPVNFAKLSSNKFNSTEVTLLPLGVWNKTELIRFSQGMDMGSNINVAGDSYIQCVAVDDVAKSFGATLVKFDIEGSELHGLMGMHKLIKKNLPALCISLYHKPEDLIEIPKLIASWDLNYKLHIRTHEHNGFGTVLYCFQ
jgi:FkbM family methyltransferase